MSLSRKILVRVASQASKLIYPEAYSQVTLMLFATSHKN